MSFEEHPAARRAARALLELHLYFIRNRKDRSDQVVMVSRRSFSSLANPTLVQSDALRPGTLAHASSLAVVDWIHPASMYVLTGITILDCVDLYVRP